ncbi:MAG: ferritin-like domain-containing protein [Myxococcales bacterium]|nr:ferritin-like domain-containing protein [Myxococcales bacterium]
MIRTSVDPLLCAPDRERQPCLRPGLVADRPSAAAATRPDWQKLALVPRAPAHLHPALAAHWTAFALAEHANVAAFAGLVLQLLAVAAPPDLVLAAQRAAADEVEHARAAFALASAFAARPVGPGPVPLARPLPTDRDRVLAAVIREVCVGETLAALEAREAAARATDPALAHALARIADDERRHAELGWRFARWALTGADVELRGRAHDGFIAAVVDAATAASALARAPATPELRPHGVLDPPLRAALWSDALTTLVVPTAHALCAA